VCHQGLAYDMPRPTGAGDGGRAVVLQLVERAISQKRQAEKQARPRRCCFDEFQLLASRLPSDNY
jgi:hypothetical protein